MSRSIVVQFILSIALLVLQACGSSGSTTPLSVLPIITETSSQDNVLQPFTTSVILPTDATNFLDTPDLTHFILPTSVGEPVSAWRPPLYPTPWALSPYDHFYFTRPIAADQINWPLADYRYGGIFFEDVVHTGVDIPAPPSTAVIAAGSGTVLWAGWGLYTGTPGNINDPYGMAVTIRHNFGYQSQLLYTVYAHLSEVNVAVGQWLETGDVLGKVGDTGFTTGPHLHFETRLGSNDYFSTRNPELWLAPPQGWGILVGRVMDTNRGLLSNFTVLVHSIETDQSWMVKTYGRGSVISDPYYNENVVLSDLPAGVYTIDISYAGRKMEVDVQIFPGQITYFTFRGFYRFGFESPATSLLESSLTPSP